MVGRDADLDLALIKVKTSRKLESLSLGNSTTLQVGEYVMAVGNPFGQGHSVTHGIISAKERMIPDMSFARYLQTDAPINPGNSGGPLINLKGEVIGINNAIDARAQGIGFAIPIDSVKQVLSQLKDKGKVSRGYLGVLVTPLSPDAASQIKAPKDLEAPMVTEVYPKGPAAKAGVQVYDVILEFADRKIHTSSDLVGAVSTTSVNSKSTLKVLRNGKEKVLSVQMAERPNGGDDETPAQRASRQPRSEGGGSYSQDYGFAVNDAGTTVIDVAEGSPADRAGLSAGDQILEIDRKPIKSMKDLAKALSANKSYLVRVKRKDPQGGEVFAIVILPAR